MKKILFLALASLMMVGCVENEENRSHSSRNEELCEKNYEVIVLDSCEYYSHKSRWDMTHKGNCKYCAQRDSIKWEKRKQEIVNELLWDEQNNK